MGLSISHNAFNGSYSSFHYYRTKLAEYAGLPPLDLMEGYYSEDNCNPLAILNCQFTKGDELEMASLRRIFKKMPIKWACLRQMELYKFLYHSDCDGYINWKACGKIANELTKLLSLMDGDIKMKELTKKLIAGMQLAYDRKEKLRFR